MGKLPSGWMEYDDTFEGKSSVVRVDMEPVSSPRERTGLPLLLLLRLAPRRNFALDLISPFQAWRLERVYQHLRRLAAKNKIRIVACRTWGSNLQAYCYCPDEPPALLLVKACQKRRWMMVEEELRTDLEWRAYRRDVYPGAAQRQTVKNGETIDLMVRHGDDIHAPRRINHYCSFPDEISRLGFQEAARKAGFALGDPFFLPDRDLPHGMCVRHIGSIDKRTLDGWTNKIIAIVEQYKGRYDYWDCQIMRKNRTRGVPAPRRSGTQKKNSKERR